MSLAVLIGALILAWPAPANAQAADEVIHDYQVLLDIQPDGKLLVTETIDYDFGLTQHHGIFRDIPDRLVYDDRYDRIFPIHVVSVQGSPGTPSGYKIEHDGGLLRIKIGDPDRTIQGEHVYTITYSVEGALNGFADHDELYWNAIGTYWNVPIESASVRVTGPSDFSQIACFTGPERSSLPCLGSDLQGATATFGQLDLDPYEGLTVVVALPKGAVPEPNPILKERWNIARAFSATPVTLTLSGALLVLLIVGVGWFLWTRGRDRRAIGSPVDVAYGTSSEGEQAVPLFESSATPVEFAPPEDIRPGQVGTLVDEVANPLDATATIVDLAVRGYLRIEEIPKKWLFGKPDWRLVKVKEADGDLLKYERLLFDGLFEDAVEEPDDEPDDEAQPKPGLAQVKLSSLRKRFAPRLGKVQEALYEDAVKRKWFSGRPDKVREKWTVFGWLILAGGVALTALVAAKTHGGLIPLPLTLAGLLLIGGARYMPRRTAKGTGMVRRVFGFRTYIETAEAQEARFQEQENLFSRYLPYAVVFGCTEKWARAFSHLSDQPSQQAWYVGTHPFTIGSFSSSIDHFAVSTAGTIASTPGGSGGSGFGGSSGGGGGGGGGGSW